MSPNSSTGENGSAPDLSSNSRLYVDSNGFRLSGDKPFVMYWYTVVIIGVAILILSAVFVAAINWFLKERRCRKLRHRLIPMYTFDPNEEDEWGEEFLDSNQPLRVKDYQSIENRENVAFSSR